MKKKALLLVISAIAIIFLSLVACTKDDSPVEKIDYDMELSLTDNILSGKEKVSYVNVYDDGISGSVFHLYANAYSQDAENPAYNDLAVYGGTQVSSVKTDDGKEYEFTISDNKEYLIIKHDELKKGEKAIFNIEFVTTIPSGDGRLAYNPSGYALSGFYPQLAVYDDGFRTDKYCKVGDPIFSSCANYKISLECDKNLVVAASCAPESKTDEGERQSITYSGENVRDFAVCLFSEYNVLSAKCGDTDVYYFYRNDENAQNTLKTATNALSVFSEAFGEYPFKTLSVVKLPFMCDGMEFSGLVYVADNNSDLEQAVIHEIAHQWWYGVVGSDCINESYMDEGLATFCTAYYYALSGDEDRFNEEIKSINRAYTSYEKLQKKRKTEVKLNMDKPIYEFSDYQYAMIEYYKACMMFNNVFELYGKAKFNKCLGKYFEDNKYGIAGKDAFIKAAESTIGDISGLMQGWIGERIVTTTFAETND